MTTQRTEIVQKPLRLWELERRVVFEAAPRGKVHIICEEWDLNSEDWKEQYRVTVPLDEVRAAIEDDDRVLCGVCGEEIPEGSPTVEDVECGTSHAFHYDDEPEVRKP